MTETDKTLSALACAIVLCVGTAAWAGDRSAPLDFDPYQPLPDGWASDGYAWIGGEGRMTTLHLGTKGCLIGPMEMKSGDYVVFAIPVGKSIPVGCAKEVIDAK